MAREIFYCNLTVDFKGKATLVKEVVYKETDGFYRKKSLFSDPVKVLNVDIIKSLGFEVENLSHTDVTKSDEQRNKITGAYE